MMDLWLPPKPAIIIPAPKELLPSSTLALTMMARTWALRTRQRAAASAGTITFVGSATGSVIDGGTLSITLSGIAGLAENDLVLAFAFATGGTPASPGGWTSIGTQNDDNAICLLARKFMTSSPDSSVSFWDTGGTAASGSGIAMAFRGVNQTNPLDVTTTENIAEPPNASAITPVSNNCAIVIFSGNGAVDTSVGTVTDYSTPVTTTSSDAESTTTAAAYRILSGGAGVSENPAAWSTWGTVSGFTFSKSYTVALRPA